MKICEIRNISILRGTFLGDAPWTTHFAFFLSLFVIIPITLLIAYLTVALIFKKTKRAATGLPKMQEIHEAIHQGAKTYLFRQSRYLAATLAVLFIPVAITGLDLHEIPLTGFFLTGVIFIIGSASSFLAGYVGMHAATLANVRVVMAIRDKSPNEGFKLGYYAGTITGILNISNFILGIWVLFLLTDMNIYLLVSYDFGASVTALFSQVGGGIFTKSADVGADLLGKIEVGIPEDDPRNPAVIADNVGDNVGDCAGRGADFFESASSEVVGGMILGMSVFILTGEPVFILLDMLYIALGIYPTLLCMRFLDIPIEENPSRVVWINFLIAMVVNIGINLVINVLLLGPLGIFIFFAGFLGLISSTLTIFVTLYYTDERRPPTKRIMSESRTGAATNVLAGLSTGFKATLFPVMIYGITLLLAGLCGYIYGESFFELQLANNPINLFGSPISRSYYTFIFTVWGMNAASASASMMIGVILSFDTFGPIMDNAAGLTEMASSETTPELRAKLDLLDATGNSTKAIAKGFALLCAAFASIVLFQNYMLNTQHLAETISGPISSEQLQNIFAYLHLSNPAQIIGIIIGVAIPVVFSSFCISAVGEGASLVADESRRQFLEVEGVATGKIKPDYNRLVDICTKQSIRKMFLPVAFILAVPLLSGILLGPFFVASILVGTLAGCLIIGIAFSISGGAMDNAKKGIESGKFGGKGTNAHKAAVVGDTVGDPLKDTAGPSLNIVLTTINTMALTFVPLFIMTGWLWPVLQAFIFTNV